MKIILFFTALILNTAIVTPIIWLATYNGNYAFLLPVILSIVLIVMTFTISDDTKKYWIKPVLIGTLVSIPTVYVVSFILLIAGGGMC